MTGMQPADRVPDLLELVVAAPGIPSGQRRALVVLVGEHGGLGTDPDQGAQPRCGRARVLRRVRQQRPVLDRAVHGQRSVAWYLRQQTDRAVHPVDRAGRLLVPVVYDDVQPGAVAAGRRVVAGSAYPVSRVAYPPDRGHRQVRGDQGRRDVLRGGPLRGGARDVPDRQADRAARDHRDQQGQHRRVQHAHVHDRVHGDRYPQRVPPGRPPDEADHGGVGDQARHGGVEGGDVARARVGHDDRVVEPAGGLPAEQVVGHRGDGGGQDAGGHRFGQPPPLAPGEKLNGQGHRQDKQGEERQRARHREQRRRYVLARAHDVGLDGSRRRAGRDAGHGQRDDLDAGQDAAQQIDRLTDAALKLILDLDLAWLR